MNIWLEIFLLSIVFIVDSIRWSAYSFKRMKKVCMYHKSNYKLTIVHPMDTDTCFEGRNHNGECEFSNCPFTGRIKD